MKSFQFYLVRDLLVQFFDRENFTLSLESIYSWFKIQNVQECQTLLVFHWLWHLMFPVMITYPIFWFPVATTVLILSNPTNPFKFYLFYKSYQFPEYYYTYSPQSFQSYQFFTNLFCTNLYSRDLGTNSLRSRFLWLYV